MSNTDRKPVSSARPGDILIIDYRYSDGSNLWGYNKLRPRTPSLLLEVTRRTDASLFCVADGPVAAHVRGEIRIRAKDGEVIGDGRATRSRASVATPEEIELARREWDARARWDRVVGGLHQFQMRLEKGEVTPTHVMVVGALATADEETLAKVAELLGVS